MRIGFGGSNLGGRTIVRSGVVSTTDSLGEDVDDGEGWMDG
jgi:hypothetical protein